MAKEQPHTKKPSLEGAAQATKTPSSKAADQPKGGLHPSAERDWLFGLLLAGVAMLAYLPALRAGFIWNDDTFLVNNPLIRRADGLYWFWFTTAPPDYFPATSTMLWLEWRLWGNNPLGYHFVNALLHALSVVLWWRVLARLKIPGAWLAAAIFALHPVNVESVAWITERKNTLAMAFFTATLLFYLKFEDGGQWRWYRLAVGMFALALLSKTAAAPLPLVLLGLAWWRRGRIERQDLCRVFPFFALALVLGLIAVWFQSHRAIGPEIVRADTCWSRLAVAGWAVWFYLYKAVLPLNLIFVYPRWRLDEGNVLSYVPVLMMAAAFLVAWHYRRRWGKSVLLGLGYFVVMLLPVLGFLDIYFMRYSLVADHWQYFAIMGPVALAAAGLSQVLGRLEGRKALLVRAICGCLLLTLGVLTWRQCGIYANTETLWRKTLARNRESYLAHTGLGAALLRRGQTDEAIAHLQTARELKPDYEIACYDLGHALLRKGQVDDAIVQLQKAVELKPDYVEAQNNLANLFLRKGQHREAIAHYQIALRFRPNGADIANNLAWLLATSPETSLRDGAQAVELAQRAERLSGSREPVFIATLAAAYAETGQFSEALLTAQRALRLASLQHNTALTHALSRQIALYQAGSPFRDTPQTNAPPSQDPL